MDIYEADTENGLKTAKQESFGPAAGFMSCQPIVDSERR